MGFRTAKITYVIILKQFNSEVLQNQVFAILNDFNVIDLQYSTTNLSTKQGSLLVEYSALMVLGDKIEKPKE